MIYTLVILSLITLSVSYHWRLLSARTSPVPPPLEPRWRHITILLIPLLVMVPIGVLMFTAYRLENGGISPRFNHKGWMTWTAIALAGLSSVAVYGSGLLQQWLHNETRFLALARNVVGVVGGLYLLFVIADNYGFYRTENAGVMAWPIPIEDIKVKDVQCEASFMAIDFEENGDVRYRCPTPLALDFFTVRPLFLWPNYAEGRSVELGKVVAKILSESKHSE